MFLFKYYRFSFSLVKKYNFYLIFFKKKLILFFYYCFNIKDERGK